MLAVADTVVVEYSLAIGWYLACGLLGVITVFALMMGIAGMLDVCIYARKRIKKALEPTYHKPIITVFNNHDNLLYSTADAELVIETMTGTTPKDNVCIWKTPKGKFFMLHNDNAVNFSVVSKENAVNYVKEHLRLNPKLLAETLEQHFGYGCEYIVRA